MIDQGYNATSLDQVIAESASSKGAFFHHFSSKADLAAPADRALRRRRPRPPRRRPRRHRRTSTDPPARVVAFLRFYEDGADELMSEQSGCLYATVLAEREFTGSDINDLGRQGDAWPGATAIVDLLRPALAARRPDLDIDVDALADHLFTTFEGGFILCRTLEDPSAMRAQLRVFRQLVEALLRLE